ncbi:glucosaminidase domain-containing protein [Shewanella maritima]|uniref:glucosaminidase domain-containing protein n=1 Tax=Shewanella maritima TaxID=2520507 RepID=UPI003736F77E
MTRLLKHPVFIVSAIAILALISFIIFSRSNHLDTRNDVSESSDSSQSASQATDENVAKKTQQSINPDAPDPVKIVSPQKINNEGNEGVQNSFVYVSKKRPEKAPKDVIISSLDDLKQLFESLNYDKAAFKRGHRTVPRLTFESVSENWQTSSHELPVDLKKEVFFRLMAPLILIANEEVLLERKRVETLAIDDPQLIAIAKRYRILTQDQNTLSTEQREQLLLRVDIIPPSLVLAQGAEESGWGTSRFTLEGNAFFGQWDFSGNGMVPQQQRKELGNYGIARFDSPLDSVRGYLINLNTNNAYRELREYRAELRLENQPITGIALANTLLRYSERGQAYVDGIQSMIRFNNLESVDEAYLSDEAPLHLISANQ